MRPPAGRAREGQEEVEGASSEEDQEDLEAAAVGERLATEADDLEEEPITDSVTEEEGRGRQEQVKEIHQPGAGQVEEELPVLEDSEGEKSKSDDKDGEEEEEDRQLQERFRFQVEVDEAAEEED